MVLVSSCNALILSWMKNKAMHFLLGAAANAKCKE